MLIFTLIAGLGLVVSYFRNMTGIHPEEIPGEWTLDGDRFRFYPNGRFVDSLVVATSTETAYAQERCDNPELERDGKVTRGEWRIEKNNELILVFDCSASMGEAFKVEKKSGREWTMVSVRSHSSGTKSIFRKVEE